MRSWRPLILAAALHTVAADIATAQTVIVTKAPPGSTVEFVLNTTTVGSKTVDADGTTSIPASPPARPDSAGMDAHIYVDACDTVRRVLVVDRTVPVPPEEAGCQRTQIPGLFLIRPVSTLVVNLGGANPTVLLRQGQFTPPAEGTVRTWSASPTGLVLSGGGSIAAFRDPVALACGNLSSCSGDASVLAYTVGADFWFSRFVAVEATYLRPAEVEIEGDQDNFRFTSFLNAHLVTIAGKAGIPVGPARLYGKIGASYHRATSGTTQISDPVTVDTTDGGTTTIAGGTQTYSLKTAGWGWLFGGGSEFWLNPTIGLYGEGGYMGVSGPAREDADGLIEDRVLFVVVGLRIHVGR